MSDSAPQSAKRQVDESETAWQERVKRIRREVVLDTLESLGFDVDDVNEMQKDALFLRKMRKASETTQAKITAAAITLFFTLVGALGTLLIQNWLGSK